MEYNNRISNHDLCRFLNCHFDELPHGVSEDMETLELAYREPIRNEVENYVFQMIKFIDDPLLTRSREENLRIWENGWSENLEDYSDSSREMSLKPKYFRPSRFLRLDGSLIVPRNSDIEYDLFCLVRRYLFHRFFDGYNAYYELGCGSCQNLAALSAMYPNHPIFGLDWTEASQKIIELLQKTVSGNIGGRRFDMIRPDEELVFQENSLVFSIHAIEQLGSDHRKLVDYLIRKRPAMVFHYEPVLELYDDSNLYDYLAHAYSRRRNYLFGFLSSLEEKEKQGILEIVYTHRPRIGGVLHESSFIAWKPA